MCNYSKKLTARLLLFSFLLESCYNPNMGMGKQALPTPAEPAYKQRQYAGEPYSKYPPKPTSHTFTTADNHPVRFTFHNEQWLAEVEEYAAHGSWQRRQLPVVFEPGLTLEDVVDSNPTEQKLLLHLCPSEEDLEKASYVYVGRAPIQAKPQLLSSPAARQTALQSEVGPIQQQATAQQQPRQPSNSAIHSKHQQAKQPQQAGTSTQQAQEQQRRQAVLALPSPVQQIGEGPKSQDQLPTTPARARSKALPATSRETPRQRVTQNQSTSAQRAPSRRALSWRNQLLEEST